VLKKTATNHTIRIYLLFIGFFIIPVATSFLPLNMLISNSIAVIALFVLSYVLVKREGKSLSILGFTKNYRDLRYLPLGMITGILLFSVLITFQIWHNKISLSINQQADYILIIKGLLLVLPGVLMEEFIFRGYCLQKATQLAGFWKANLIFAFFFVVWHWLAFNAWGNYGLMLSLFTTGFGHFLFSVAFTRSKTLFLPIGIHLGNNWAARNLFSSSMGSIVSGEKTQDSFFHLTASTQVFTTLHTIISYVITLSCFLIGIVLIRLFVHRKLP
jgi:membrane protease YdiL (CAAX protease family)